MSNTIATIPPAVLGTSFSTIYAVPAATTFTTGIFHVANTDASPHTVSIVVNTGSGDNQAQSICWLLNVPANDFIEFGQGLAFSAGWTIDGEASAANVLVVILSGIATM